MAKPKGFTLIETMISLSIFILIMLLIWGWQKDVFSINTLLTKRITTQDNLRKTLKNFIAEVRAGQLSANGASIIERANKNEFIFFSDLDYDQSVERIRYFLSNHKLKKGIIEPTGQPPVYNSDNENILELVSYVINTNDEVFFYYDKNYDGTSPALVQPVNIPDIRLIQITVTVNENPDRPPESITETSQTSIRNLKDNL
jgi:type II secretory pathway pseudopilin PulG